MKKSIVYLILIILFLAGSTFFFVKSPEGWLGRLVVSSVLAEDEEEEESEEDEDEDDEDEDNEEYSSGDDEEKTITTYVKLPDEIIKKLIEITIFDSDGDGVFDPEDSTPNLHNIFIVKDANFNGIVDEYENR